MDNNKLIKDLEELDNGKLAKWCTSCEFSERGIGGDWCYMQVSAPLGSKCPNFILKRSIKEAIALRGLYNKFPNLEER